MVFIHGIFFGSDDEMNLAHNEGYLFELFRDTGLFNPIPNLSTHGTPQARCNGDDDDDEDGEEDEDYGEDFLTDFSKNDDSFVIDQVAKSNLSRKKTSKTNFSSISKQLSFQTDFSTLSSLNKQSLCENYVKAHCQCSQNNSSLKCSSNHMDCMLKGECKLSADEFEFKIEFDEHQLGNEAKRITPPGEILAVITKRSERVKEAIARRNQELLGKSK